MKNGSLMKVKSIAECPLEHSAMLLTSALSDNWSWKPIFVFFKSGRFTQVFLYIISSNSVDTG